MIVDKSFIRVKTGERENLRQHRTTKEEKSGRLSITPSKKKNIHWQLSSYFSSSSTSKFIIIIFFFSSMGNCNCTKNSHLISSNDHPLSERIHRYKEQSSYPSSSSSPSKSKGNQRLIVNTEKPLNLSIEMISAV